MTDPRGADISTVSLSPSFKVNSLPGTTAEVTSYPDTMLRYQVVDSSGAVDADGYELHKDSFVNPGDPPFTSTTCSSPSSLRYPIGSSLYNSSSSFFDLNGASGGQTFFKVFVRPTSTTTFGKRKIQFYYNGDGTGVNIGVPVGQAEFELTDPNY